MSFSELSVIEIVIGATETYTDDTLHKLSMELQYDPLGFVARGVANKIFMHYHNEDLFKTLSDFIIRYLMKQKHWYVFIPPELVPHIDEPRMTEYLIRLYYCNGFLLPEVTKLCNEEYQAFIEL